MTRFLLTGASGFVGSAILRRLLADGHRVVTLGRTAVDADHPNVEALTCDLLTATETDLTRQLAGRGLTHCIHGAWYTNHADYLVHDVNREWVGASLRLAAAFERSGGQRLVGLGTCLEYDAWAGGPCSELTTPLVPETLYARCKLQLSEQLLTGDHDRAWARIFFVYGPGDRAGRLVPAILNRLLSGQEMAPTFGALRRDYIHVDDLAAQIVRIAESAVRGAVNCGTGEAPSLSEIVEIAADLVGRPDLPQPNDLIGDNPPLIQADMARFEQMVGAPSTRGIRAGLTSLLEVRSCDH